MAKARSARKTRRNASARRAAGTRKPPARAGASGRDLLGWPPSKFALWSQRWGDPSNSYQTFPTTVLLRHPTAPFTGTASVTNLEDDLKRIAHDYLVAASSSQLVEPSLGLPAEWLDALDPGRSDPSFGWLPFGWPTTSQTLNSLVSFSASRTSTGRSPDLMMIMQASQPTGSGYGIRVVAHVRKPKCSLDHNLNQSLRSASRECPL